ncbi:MAG: hypothetical protein PHW13_02665 [Methylococcales bacterium]|nr:hypothetical protein [Methylococcales bacterium]
MRNTKTNLSRAIGMILAVGLSSPAFATDTSTLPTGIIDSGPITFNANDLVVTSSFYEGTDAAIVSGSTVLAGKTAGTTSTAVADSSYLNVWNNTTPDASFGITSPIIVSDVSTSGATQATYNLTAMAASQGVNLVTSFSSKSELAVNLSTDGSALTVNGYDTTAGQLDISNSNTPGLIDPTNPTDGIAASTFRSIAQLNVDGSMQVEDTNAYSGNNGRATILDNATGTYYIVGNAGNTGTGPTTATLASLSNNTGVQSIAAGSNNGTLGQISSPTTAQINTANTTVIGEPTGSPTSSTGYQNGFNTTSVGNAADKTGKDDNFRGETVFDGTLYVTKGSGSNGVDSVYQVGATGSLDSLAANSTTTPISILPGFPTASAKTTTPTNYPFGIWFANATTLYVADEGAGGTITSNGDNGVAGTGVAASDNQAGLEKWVLNTSTGVWSEAYVLQTGLDLGASYSVSGTSIGSNDQNGTAGTYTAATDGLRELTGQINADGSVTLYATTSTISNSGDQGADPNKLVAITDYVAAGTVAQSQTALGSGADAFTTLQTAAYGQVLRGVSFSQTGSTGVQSAVTGPVPLPPSLLMMLSGLGLTGMFVRRGKRA